MLTVRNVLEQLFPQTGGVISYLQWPVGGALANRLTNEPYAVPPLVPFDVFAVCARLLDLSGAYHHVVPLAPRLYDPQRRQWERTSEFARVAGIVNIPEREPARRLLTISQEKLDECRATADIWRRELDVLPEGGRSRQARSPSNDEKLLRRRFLELSRAPHRLTQRWQQLFDRDKSGSRPVFEPAPPDEPPPKWWHQAHELMIIADEACQNVGFFDPESPDMPWFEEIMLDIQLHLNFEAWQKKPPESRPQWHYQGIQTLSFADPDMACVLPKARTSAVGCTLRSLSHHLALIPAQGIARAHWYHPLPGFAPREDREMNILLVPYPFRISDRAFHGVMGSEGKEPNWGLFEVWQHWLHDLSTTHVSRIGLLTEFICELARDACARHGARSIDMIVLPELAIDYETYGALSRILKQEIGELELFVAGLSSNEMGREGNFVAVTMFNPAASERDSLQVPDGEEGSIVQTTIREKHHKWKIDRAQLRTYGLEGALNPRLDWWEDIDLLSRRVDFTAFRHSVMAAMICEDLARVDPCQELLRSIGPNLVVALLMDAPQLENRWPARYATILSEDPGCAVLTLTSRALMARQDQLARENRIAAKFQSSDDSDRVIALWRDDVTGGPIPIACGMEDYGVWLKVWYRTATDVALDGRSDQLGKRWIYGKHRGLTIDDVENRFGSVIGVNGTV